MALPHLHLASWRTCPWTLERVVERPLSLNFMFSSAGSLTSPVLVETARVTRARQKNYIPKNLLAMGYGLWAMGDRTRHQTHRSHPDTRMVTPIEQAARRNLVGISLPWSPLNVEPSPREARAVLPLPPVPCLPPALQPQRSLCSALREHGRPWRAPSPVSTIIN